jgi:hypothetical protein
MARHRAYRFGWVESVVVTDSIGRSHRRRAPEEAAADPYENDERQDGDHDVRHSVRYRAYVTFGGSRPAKP